MFFQHIFLKKISPLCIHTFALFIPVVYSVTFQMERVSFCYLFLVFRSVTFRYKKSLSVTRYVTVSFHVPRVPGVPWIFRAFLKSELLWQCYGAMCYFIKKNKLLHPRKIPHFFYFFCTKNYYSGSIGLGIWNETV